MIALRKKLSYPADRKSGNSFKKRGGLHGGKNRKRVQGNSRCDKLSQRLNHSFVRCLFVPMCKTQGCDSRLEILESRIDKRLH